MSRYESSRSGRGPLSRRKRIWLCGLAALLCLAAAATAVFVPLDKADNALSAADRQDKALQQLAQLRTALADFQVLLEPSLSAPRTAAALSLDLAKAAQLGQTVDGQARAVVTALTASGHPATARTLAAASTSFTAAYSGLAPLAAGVPLAQATKFVTAERTQFTRMWATTAAARDELQSARNGFHRDGTRAIAIVRGVLWGVTALTALVLLTASLWLGQRAHRRQRRDLVLAERQAFSSDLQEALEMAATELDVYTVVRRGLRTAVPQRNVQLLVADSSRAHLHEALNTAEDPTSWAGCGVPSPADCPATTRGHTMIFPSSTALNACPYLQDRPKGDCSAACVPISITGNTVGVTHATGLDGVVPGDNEVRYLELTSRRAADRIAMLRAFEKSETQARSDPLTGLLNRRSLQNSVRELTASGAEYAVAYGDLDKFKIVNDTYGHQAGDQALRLFSRVLRESVRPDDITARYGGEEFLIVFPQTDVESATAVVERVRERLALALIAGQVAPFTVSFGVAPSRSADTFDGVVTLADQALLAAKAAGRDRVIVAGAPAKLRT